MANRVLELMLDRVELKDTGTRRKKGLHMVVVSLVWPRPRVAERVSTKMVEFKENVVDFKKSDWISRIVFKELIDGPFGIEMGITERMSDSEVASFFRFMGSSLMKLIGNEAEDMMANPLSGGLVKLPFRYLSKFISELDNKGPKIIASGSMVAHSDETWKKKKETKTFKISLTAPETIYKVTRVRQHGRLQTRRRTIIKAGDDNGVIKFTGKVY